MRVPETPPSTSELIAELKSPKRLMELELHAREARVGGRYLHWDELRRRKPPAGLSHREWWLVMKLARGAALKPIGLKHKEGRAFRFAVEETVMEALHEIDTGAGGLVSVPEPITNPETRDRYLVSSLIEEAITSSQLEGAVTTREVAKEMIRTGRRPRDMGERMILNNYRTMQHIRDLKSSALSPDLVFELHRLLTEGTLEDPSAAGRFRKPGELVVVGDDYGEVFHDPPEAKELPGRMKQMCAFANGEKPDYFIHPAVRAILLHFWLAYDHPFVDGNGRTARALFYWAMLRHGYWLFEFLSISSILRKAPAQYGRSFLFTETDENDLTYFLIAQADVIRRSVKELHAYIKRKTEELQELEVRMRALDMFNHRQAELIRHALRHPGHRYTFASHGTSHGVAYQTARTDLLGLHERGLLIKRKRGKQMMFTAPSDLAERLAAMEQCEE